MDRRLPSLPALMLMLALMLAGAELRAQQIGEEAARRREAMEQAAAAEREALSARIDELEALLRSAADSAPTTAAAGAEAAARPLPAEAEALTRELRSMMDDSTRTPAGVLSTTEIALSIGVLAFTAIIIGISAWIRVRQAISGDATFKLLGLGLVVGASLFLITAGYSKDQVTPVVGLLGTALGFIFGKQLGDDPKRQDR